jgi:hypothetical protein
VIRLAAVTAPVLAFAVLVTRDARADGPDVPSPGAHELAPEESALPWRKSAFIFDQSVSTQTAGLSPLQSYVPVYEWWLSFRPRYYFSDKVYVRARFDYYKEFTNSEQTTYYREDVFGDVWADLIYETPVPALSKDTKASAGARFLFPTSKVSADSGIYVQAGATASIKQTFPIHDRSAPFLSEAHVGLSGWYDHPFSRATTPTNESLDYVRQDTGGRSFLSDQLRGATLVNHQLVATLDTGLQITPRLSLLADLILYEQWHYAATPNPCVQTATGCAAVTTPPGFGTTHQVNTWFLTSIDYALFDEMTLSLGYYNLANQIRPDGNRASLSPFDHDNVWWSPDARIFFDVTANLDAIYEWARGKKTLRPEVPEDRHTTAISRQPSAHSPAAESRGL